MTNFNMGVALTLVGIGGLLFQLAILMSGSKMPLNFPITYMILCLVFGICLGRGMGLMYFYKNK